jgi:hypothetical protein
MNEELQNALLSLINQATTFASGEIPEVLHQVLIWNLTASIAWMIAGIVWFVVAWRFYKYATLLPREQRKEGVLFDRAGDKREEAIYFLCVFGGIFSLLFANALIFSPFEIAKILLAPKLYLIEYAAHLAK